MTSDLPLILLFLVVGSIKPSEERIVEGSSEVSSNPCELFEMGDPDLMEFYSPNYPNRYPADLDCNLILEAPEGHLLKVDFRDGFHLEPMMPECKFDFLEIRDGIQGYSNQIGLFCDHQYPPVIISSGRHLWLRFHSDKNTEYTGFRAVYEYIPKPTADLVIGQEGECRMELSGMEGFVNISDIDMNHVVSTLESGKTLDCVWLIQVQPDWRIQLWFTKFILSLPNDCDSNFLDVFSDRTDIPSRLKNFCGTIAEMVLSEGNVLTVRYFASGAALKKFNSTKIEALFTAFKEKPSGKNCSDLDLYDCEDGNCISWELKCNQRFNCRYRGDEDIRICKPPETLMKKILKTYYMKAILVLFFLMLFGMCCAFFYHCIKKLIRDQKIIREQMQRSRDAKLEQIGKKTPAGAVMTPLVAVVGKGQERYNNWPKPPMDDINPEEGSSSDSSVAEERTVVEMREVEIQTRESLFHSPGSSPASSVPRQTFKTFGYDDSEDRSETEPPKNMGTSAGVAASLLDPRGTSLESTKSAPDVIMSH